jgi:hypothetical protein
MEAIMKKFTLAAPLAVLASAAVLTAMTPAAAQPRRDCLRVNQIDSFSPIRGNERAMVVIDKFRNKYKISFNTVCQDLDFNGAIQIRTNSNFGLSCIERGDRVISRSFAGWRDRCVITGVERYTPAMERADRRNYDRDVYRR